MGETLQPVSLWFSRSLSVEARTDRLTGDPGAILLREVLEGSGIIDWMTKRMVDPRRQEDVTHDLASLLRTSVLLAAQGWRDHDDADALRHDPAFRLATTEDVQRTNDGKETIANSVDKLTGAVKQHVANKTTLVICNQAGANVALQANGMAH